MPRKLHLAVAVYGVGGPGQHGLWKDPRVPKNASIDIGYYIKTASSTYNSPFNLARRFASLDLISGGRAGWNVVTSFDTGTSKNYGLAEHLDYATRYGRALEAVQVIQGLWDSYEDDAFVADVERNVFLDPDRLHALHHAGEHFSVAGPLNISRSAQGQPVIFQAGVSEDGRNLAANVAEGIYAPGGTLAEAQAYFADIKRRAAALGRDPDHVVIFTGASPVVGGTDDEAARLSRDSYEADNDFGRKLGFLGRAFGAYDFSQHDLDAPFPDVAHLAEKGGRTRGLELVERAREQGLTLRQVVEEVTEYHPSPFTGAPDTVADAIADWFEAGAADGLNLRFRTLADLEPFAGDVVPLLTKRGVFRSAYEGETLRSHLGLPVPVNRYTVARQSARGEVTA